MAVPAAIATYDGYEPAGLVVFVVVGPQGPAGVLGRLRRRLLPGPGAEYRVEIC